MLVALGFNRETRVFVAGAHIYGGNKRLAALTSLYPNLVTKEKLLSPSELQPFKNFSSQVIKKLGYSLSLTNNLFKTLYVVSVASGFRFHRLCCGKRFCDDGFREPVIVSCIGLSDILWRWEDADD